MGRPAQPTAGLADTPRLALRREDAARALGVSDETFDRYVRPELRCVRLGAVRAYPVSELQRYLDEHAVSPREDLAA
jgi:hypothetical protein